MYAGLPAEVRDKHPYFMYDEIKAQPEAVAGAIRIAEEQGASARSLISRARRVYLTGCGTSFYAAQGGEWLLRTFTRGRVDVRAVQAFELATYHPALRPDDLVVAVTHSGSTTMTLRALDRAQRAGCETLAVTGFPDSKAGAASRHVLSTGFGQERSWAHTASYTATLASLAALANSIAEAEERLDLSPLPQVMAAALELEEMAHRVAASTIVVERYREPPGILVVGAGPNAITAHEAVLKLLETSYARATAFELEQALHGPLAAVTPETLVILVAPPGRSTARAAELAGALAEIGVIPVALVGEGNAGAFEEAHRLVLPDVPEVVSPLPWVVPLQLISYFLAVGKGLNPDLIHRDDERYRAARGRYE